MSNNNELNTDEQIEQLNQKLQDMNNTEQNTASENNNEEFLTFHSDAEKTQNAQEQTAEQTDAEENTEVFINQDNTEDFAAEQTENIQPETASASQAPVNNTEAPSIPEKCFNIFSKLGLPLLILSTLILCGQQFLFPRDFWFSEEVRYADIYMNMLSSHNFFTLTLNGHPYAETGPLYFILVWLLDAVPTINMPQAFFGASILFAVFFVASTWILARGLGYSGKVAFAAGLITLSMFFLASFTNYTRMDLLFAGFLNLSYVCFYRAWQKKSAPIWLLFAFLFLCFASLTSTFIAYVLPFAASIFFFLWTAKYKRINSADGIIGFLLSILIIFGWFAYIYMQGSGDYISLLLEEQIIQNFTPLSAFKSEAYWYYLAGLPLALFPWVFIILFASWGSWCKNIPAAFKSRKENNASAWLIFLILTHLGIFSLFKDKSFSNLVTVIPFFAILFAKSLLNFGSLRSKIFFGFLALLTSLCGIFFIVLEFHGYILEYLPDLWILPKEIPAFVEVLTTNTYFGLTTMGAILILLGVLLWYGVKRQFAGGSLLIYTIGIILMLQPLNLLIAPQMGTVFSTKNHAYAMAKVHQEDGAIPASYNIYPDVFTYYYNEALDKNTYSKATIAEFNSIEPLTEFLLNNDKVILAISEKDFEQLPYKNEAAILDYKQWIEHQYIILTYWNISSHKPGFENSSGEDTLAEDKNTVINSDTTAQPSDKTTSDTSADNAETAVQEQVESTQENAQEPQSEESNANVNEAQKPKQMEQTEEQAEQAEQPEQADTASPAPETEPAAEPAKEKAAEEPAADKPVTEEPAPAEPAQTEVSL